MEKLSYSLPYLGPKPNPTPNWPNRPPRFLFHLRVLAIGPARPSAGLASQHPTVT
jgi:hypothetical protein